MVRLRIHQQRALRLCVTAMLALLIMALLGSPAWGQSYQATILTSDIANISNNTDGNLVNPWGLVASSSSPW